MTIIASYEILKRYLKNLRRRDITMISLSSDDMYKIHFHSIARWGVLLIRRTELCDCCNLIKIGSTFVYVCRLSGFHRNVARCDPAHRHNIQSSHSATNSKNTSDRIISANIMCIMWWFFSAKNWRCVFEHFYTWKWMTLIVVRRIFWGVRK